jgi:hypothetical protein
MNGKGVNMNLLEHYIVEIKSEQKIQNPQNGNEYYRVNAIVDCYGREEEINSLFLLSEWEQAKQKGYYMA